MMIYFYQSKFLHMQTFYDLLLEATLSGCIRDFFCFLQFILFDSWRGSFIV